MTPLEAKDFVTALRTTYPRPSSTALLEDNNKYCVGGALVCALYKASLSERNSAYTFPAIPLIAKTLSALNPNLPNNVALSYAVIVVNQNSYQQFDLAYNTIEKALAHGSNDN